MLLTHVGIAIHHQYAVMSKTTGAEQPPKTAHLNYRSEGSMMHFLSMKSANKLLIS
jgi:hypothetical protein